MSGRPRDPNNPDKPGSGGARLKVRDDDRRGQRPEGTPYQPAYEPNDYHRNLVREYGGYLDLGMLATKIGISETTIYRHYRKEIEAAEANLVADCATGIAKAAAEGNVAALKFILQARGGRLWSTKHEYVTPPRQLPSGEGGSEFDEAAFQSVMAESDDGELEIIDSFMRKLERAKLISGPTGDSDREESSEA